MTISRISWEVIPRIARVRTTVADCSDLLDELDAALTSAEEAVTVEDLQALEARRLALTSRA